MHLGFFKITGKTCSRICIHLHLEYKLNNQQGFYLMMLMQCFVCLFVCVCVCVCVCVFLLFFIEAHVVSIHLNCIDKLMQFKWVPTTHAFIKK